MRKTLSLILCLAILSCFPLFSPAFVPSSIKSDQSTAPLLKNTNQPLFLQLAVFQEQSDAKQYEKIVSEQLHKPTRIEKIQKNGKSLYTVQVGPLSSVNEAKSLQTTWENSKASAQSISKAPEPRAKPSTTAEPSETRLWNLRDVDLHTVIDEVSRETGKNFIVDPHVQGKVSIISSTPLNPEEVYQVFLSVLQVAGFSAIPSGHMVKIVPSTEARNMEAPVRNFVQPGQGDEIVVRVIAIKHVSAMQLVPVLRPLLPQWAVITAYRPSNSIILSGRANNLERVSKIIASVDVPTNSQIEIIHLKHALAADIVKTLQSLQLNTQSTTDLPPPTVAADDHTNSILLSGSQSQRLQLRIIITDLDYPIEQGSSGYTQIVYLRYLHAEDLAPILAGIARSQYEGAVGVTIGQRSRQAEEDVTGNGSIPTPAPAATSTSAAPTGSDNSNLKPKVEIIAEPNTNSLILNAPASLMRTMKTVISRLDVRPTQILVESLIAEVDLESVKTLGIEWGAIVDASVSGVTPEGFIPGIAIINDLHNNLKQFQAVIRSLETDNRANILSTPSVVVLDNHRASIKVGQEVSVPTSSYPNNAGGTTGGTPYTTFEREKVALELTVTPQINEGDAVLLKIQHANNSLVNPNDTTANPIFNISTIGTSVIVNSGDILVLGGLIQHEVGIAGQKIPILGDLPFIGELFHHHSDRHKKRCLMVFIRPIILKNRNDSVRVTGGRYDFTRADQISFLQEVPFHEENMETVLPLQHEESHLPHPFHENEPQNKAKIEHLK